MAKTKSRTQTTKTPGDTRLIIGFTALVVFLLLLLFTTIFVKQIVYYEMADFNNGWKIFGRIYFVFIFYILGISARSFKFYTIGKKQELMVTDPWKVYLIEYGLFLGIVVPILIFSAVSAVNLISSTPVFYLMSSSLAVIAGFKGYAFLHSVDLPK